MSRTSSASSKSPTGPRPSCGHARPAWAASGGSPRAPGAPTVPARVRNRHPRAGGVGRRRRCVAAAALLPRRVIGLAVLLLILFALQSVFVAVRDEYPAVAALHPLNGFLILLVGIVIARDARASIGASVAA